MFEDKSPHQSKFLSVNGHRLHYLDWRGNGKTLLFLPGLGDSAHIFDDIAPQFTARFRVLGMTRRGQGQSEIATSGYDTATLAEDIQQFLEQLNIARVTLVGHSLAGDEMTYFAGKYPQMVDRLIYFDANYDAAIDTAIMKTIPVPYPSTSEEDTRSIVAYRQWLQRNMYGGRWSNALEANLHDFVNVAADGTFTKRMPSNVAEALLKDTIPTPDYASIQAPVLAIFAIKDHFPGIEMLDAATQETVQAWMQQVVIPLLRQAADQLRKRLPQAQVVELTGLTHYFFIDQQAEVVKTMYQFLEQDSAYQSSL
jgi:non-heme chloroperoxidase